MQMLAQHVVRHDPRSVTTAVLNQLVILLVHDTTINAVSSLQLLRKKWNIHFCRGEWERGFPCF